jgi:hypothetical protein
VRRVSLPTFVLLLVLAAQGAFLIWLVTGLYFVWGDDYDFLLLRGTIPGVGVSWLEPHDDHWMTSVVVIFRVIFHFFGVRTYVPYGVVTVVLHLATALVMFLLVRRLGARPWPSVFAGTFVAFLGAGAQAVLWDTTMGLIGSIFFGFLAVYLGARFGYHSGRLRWSWLPLVVGLTFSGTGVVAVAFAAAFAWCRTGWRAGLRVLSVPTGVFVLWYISYGRTGAKPPLADHWAYLQVPAFVWTGLTSAVGAASGIPGAGGALTVALVLGTVMAPRHVPAPLRHLALAGLIGAFAQLSLAAITRPMFGIDDFSSGRYAYLTMVFLTPAVLVGLSGLAPLVKEPRHVVAFLAGVLLVAYAVNGQHLFRKEFEGRSYVTGPWPGIMRGIRAAAQEGEAVLTRDTAKGDFPNRRFRADLVATPTMWKELPAGQATPKERLDAEQRFFVSVGSTSKGLLVRTKVELSFGFTTQPKPGFGCSVHSTSVGGSVIAVETGDTGAEVGVFGPNSTFTTSLRRGDLSSANREWQVEPAVSHFVSTTAKDAELFIAVDKPGTYKICKG